MNVRMVNWMVRKSVPAGGLFTDHGAFELGVH